MSAARSVLGHGLGGLVALGIAAAACSSTPTATVTIVTGPEFDAFSKNPAPSTIVVESIDVDLRTKELSRTPLPADELSLGDVPKTDVGALRVTAFDPAGKPLLRGESLFVQFGALADTAFEVFVQRTGEFARMPRPPGATLPSPHVRLVVGRYLLATSGKGATLYDLLLLRAFTSPPQMPREAWSLATYGTTAIAIDDKGASTVELSTGQTTELPTPTGGTFAEVAGGTTVLANDGTQYVVGATRSGAPTARVLRLGTDGALTFLALANPRAGACATWVQGRGLVVVGGSATAPGAEVLGPGATLGAPLPYPPDPTQLCGAGTLDTGHVVVAGGVGGTATGARVLDLACAGSCTPAIWPGAVPLRRADVVALAADAAFVVGDDADGNSHAYRASAFGASEVAFRVPRKGARLATMPYRALAVVGGAPEVEQYLE